ncbi:MAG: hypothetical protein AAGJ82_15500, partial [Bacteroidota bacterium]
MSNRKTNRARAVEIGLDTDDKRALWRTILLSSILLGLVLTLVYLLLGKLFPANIKLLNASRTALSLLGFWVVITSTVRTFDRVREGIHALWLVLIGVLSASVGIVLFLIALRVWNELGDHGAALPGFNILGFYAAAGLVASLISLINLRVERELMGNLL